MNRHSFRVIEFEKIRAQVRDRCLTREAESVIRKQRILVDRAEIAETLDQVDLLRTLLETTISSPTLSFPSQSETLVRISREGTMLEAEQFGDLITYLSSAIDLDRYLNEAAKEASLNLAEGAFAVELEIEPLRDHLARFVDPDGTVREREIPELRAIRLEIQKAQQSLTREAGSMATTEAGRGILSSTVPTQRDGRVVLAVKANHKGKVTGIVHEVSGTGSTVFIEPASLVELNNTVVESEHRYRNALLKILRELTDRTRQDLDRIESCVDWVTRVDLIMCRARHGRDLGAVRAGFAENGLILRSARHPLLGDTAVPIHVEIPHGKRVLIVTGPNTGGKTVSLKTVGLFAMMHQFGLHVPTAPGTEIPLFTAIYADIGDEQSIEQNLSTFSGHMRNVARILNHADENSLVLLDELGSGTDPEEGGALAMAVLDELLTRNAYTIVTTHHGRLKHYGFVHERATNASVEFDSDSLRPTYHIVPGVPGSSHAVDIARHMGVLKSVTRQAKEYLSGEEYDTGRIIRRLTDREQELRQLERTLESKRSHVSAQEAALAELQESLNEREREVRLGRVREFESWASETRSRLENLVRELREGELTSAKTKAVKEFISETDTRIDSERESAQPVPRRRREREQTIESHAEIAPHSEVVIARSGRRGTVLRRGKGATWIVQAGNVKLPLPESDLRAVATPTAEAKPQVSVSMGAARPSIELDVRGRRLDEALAELDRQIDQALISGMTQFGVIHGMGEGILQRGIRESLRANPHVSSVSYAAPEDGGFGKTLVVLG